MKLPQIILGLVLISFSMISCSPSAPSTLEIMDALENEVNERDMESVMALFAEEAVVEESFCNIAYYGLKEIEHMWTEYFRNPYISEFRDISVEGNSATFIWTDVGTSFTKLWPTIIEVQNGKITYMDFYEDAETILTEEE